MTDISYPIRDGAQKVGVSVDTLRRAWRQGHITFKSIGGKYFVSRDELDRWFNDQPAAIPGPKKR